MVTIPLTRTVNPDQYPPPVAVTRSDGAWEVEPGTRPNVLTQLPDIRVSGDRLEHSFVQTVINLYIFNRLDPRRVVARADKEFLYMVAPGETVVIPPLPPNPHVRWSFTLGTEGRPVLRFTFDNEDEAPARKRRWLGN